MLVSLLPTLVWAWKSMRKVYSKEEEEEEEEKEEEEEEEEEEEKGFKLGHSGHSKFQTWTFH
jgi:hypothetical protein